ncbi:MAG: response regulator [Gammaproteobacteria bacterium]|nr:response regulator [Gammaproteobacteria bacterium]
MHKQVLIVDDSSMMRKLITRTLTSIECDIVGEASNGVEALELYKELKPDLVTMDITMRGMDGFTAAQGILEFDDKAKILFLSNLDDDKYREMVVEVGGVGMAKKHHSDEIAMLIKAIDE